MILSLDDCLWADYFIPIRLVPPYERLAFAVDTSIAYPLLKETVPNWLLGVSGSTSRLRESQRFIDAAVMKILAVALPVIVIIIASLVATRKGERNYDLQTSLLGM